MVETIFRRQMRVLGNWIEILDGMKCDLEKMAYAIPIPEENVRGALEAIGLLAMKLECIRINLKVLDEIAIEEVKK